MGFLEDVLGGLFKCLCGSPQDEGRPQQQQQYYPPQQPIVQQPTPVYPPSQPQPQPWQQPQPSRPQQQPAHPSYAQAAQEHAPEQPEHKKHKKPNKHGGESGHASDSGQGGSPYIAHTPAPASPPSSPPHAPSRPWSPGRPDPNQINQHNEYYVGLRAKANAAGDEMARSFDEAHRAYAGGDGARAKELSNAGKAAQREMERLNEEASAWIFRENNTDSGPGEVDLHGLYVKEAIKYADQSIGEARARGDSKIRFIVGKGLHSTNHVAKIKPAIEELMQKHGLVAELDEHNAGVLIVNLDGQTSGQGPVMGADELTRGLEKKDECVIM